MTLSYCWPNSTQFVYIANTLCDQAWQKSVQTSLSGVVMAQLVTNVQRVSFIEYTYSYVTLVLFNQFICFSVRPFQFLSISYEQWVWNKSISFTAVSTNLREADVKYLWYTAYLRCSHAAPLRLYLIIHCFGTTLSCYPKFAILPVSCESPSQQSTQYCAILCLLWTVDNIFASKNTAKSARLESV